MPTETTTETTTSSSVTVQDLTALQQSMHNDLVGIYSLLLLFVCYIIGRDVVRFIKSWMYIGM